MYIYIKCFWFEYPTLNVDKIGHYIDSFRLLPTAYLSES